MIPRSYAGALRSVEDVRLVIVQGEPSKPESESGEIRERFRSDSSVEQRLEQAAWYSFSKLMDPSRFGGTEYHHNLTHFVEDCFRNDDGMSLPFKERMAKTWITASVLCNIPTKAVDDVPEGIVVRCAEHYLLRELALFAPHKPVLVAMGKGKAARRLRLLGIEGFIETCHPGKPASIRRHKDDERTPCVACNLACAAERVRSQLQAGPTWRVQPGSIAAQVMSGEEVARQGTGSSATRDTYVGVSETAAPTTPVRSSVVCEAEAVGVGRESEHTRRSSMKRSLVQASFFFGQGKPYPSLKTFREAHTLAKRYGDPTSAVAVHYAIAACLPEAGYPIKAYPCAFQQAYSGYPERAEEVHIDDLMTEKRAIAERAIVERAAIERIHAEEFPDYTTMALPERIQAAKRFQERVQQLFRRV